MQGYEGTRFAVPETRELYYVDMSKHMKIESGQARKDAPATNMELEAYSQGKYRHNEKKGIRTPIEFTTESAQNQENAKIAYAITAQLSPARLRELLTIR
jgi:hypothetical protein